MSRADRAAHRAHMKSRLRIALAFPPTVLQPFPQSLQPPIPGKRRVSSVSRLSFKRFRMYRRIATAVNLEISGVERLGEFDAHQRVVGLSGRQRGG